MGDRVESFEEFWPYYVGAHRTRPCRALHYVGTSMGIVTAVVAVVTGPFEVISRCWVLR
ncbi:MAG: DUF962 domain-containing protein [Myxococcales bacterium]|nr:MAG: DUF962 domain-containing protein [Myxococcales bacterium]